MHFDPIIQKIRMERERQENKWGVQNHIPSTWVVILTEEVGEVARATLGYNTANGQEEYETELIHCAAVCVAALESLQRNKRL